MLEKRIFAIITVGLLALNLGLGCKKKGEDKKSTGEEAMSAEAMDAPDPMDGDEGGEGMASARPTDDPRDTAEAPPPAEAPEEPEVEDKEAVAEGVITHVKGTVDIRRAGKTEFEPAAKDDHVFAKDAVRAGKDGEATITLWDNSTIELPAETAVTVNVSEAIKDAAPSVTVMAGAARFDVTPRIEGQGPFSVKTPAAAVSVQGTILAVGVGISGSVRVAVESGKVELVPVVQLDAKPLEVPQGKVVVIPFGKPASTPSNYVPAQAGWDDWLEEEDSLGDKADALAALHAAQVEALNKDANTLDEAWETSDDEAEKLNDEAEEAEKTDDSKGYAVVQPKIAERLETQATIREMRQLAISRLVAHSYLLSLMRARMRAGVIKASPAVLAQVEEDYMRAVRLSELRRRADLRRYRAERPRMQRWQRSYYRHHPQGRALAPRMKVEVPTFYAKTRIAPRPRPAVVQVAGWDRPVYRRPMYRGKARPYRPPVLVASPGVPSPVVPVFRPRSWETQAEWRAAQQARHAQQKAPREVWKKAVIERRAQRWEKRADTRQFHRPPAAVRPDPRVRDPRVREPRVREPRVRDPRVRDPRVLDPRVREPRIRDPHGMVPPGVGPGPMLRDPREPRIRDPHGMVPPGVGPGPMLRDPRDPRVREPRPGRPPMPPPGDPRRRGMDR